MKTLLRFLVLILLSICFCAVLSHDLYAASVASEVVSPARADVIASPLIFRSVQSSTETDNPALLLHTDGTPHLVRVGIDTLAGGKNQVYNLPVMVALGSEFQAQLDLPFATTTLTSYSAGSSSDTGLADIVLSLKYRVEGENRFESYYIVSAKLPSGDPEKGLGTGGYDFSFTHKSIFMCGDYRTALMAGITIPPPTGITILGSKVEYGPTISYMVATERELAAKNLRVAIKAAGLHAFNSRINSEYQKNGLTTLDLIPEVSYRFAEGARVTAGIIIPFLTIYDLPGATNRRDLLVNFSLSKSF